jgi:hypothetical protein
MGDIMCGYTLPTGILDAICERADDYSREAHTQADSRASGNTITAVWTEDEGGEECPEQAWQD